MNFATSKYNDVHIRTKIKEPNSKMNNQILSTHNETWKEPEIRLL